MEKIAVAMADGGCGCVRIIVRRIVARDDLFATLSGGGYIFIIIFVAIFSAIEIVGLIWADIFGSFKIFRLVDNNRGSDSLCGVPVIDSA